MVENKKTVGAIVQARMGSERLPGKMLVDIAGKPLIQHVIDRISRSKKIDKIILATTDNPKDTILVQLAKKNSLDYFAGDEEDVLDRFYQSAKRFNIDIIVRITPDDPFKDPQVIDEIIGYYIQHLDKYDYVSNTIKSTYPEGLDIEVFSFSALEKAWREAQKLSEREHVTPYIWKHPDIFRLKNIEYVKDLSSLRWTLDNKKDLTFAKEIYRRLYKRGKIFLMNDILELLDKNPHLIEINRDKARWEGYIRSLEKDKLSGFKE